MLFRLSAAALAIVAGASLWAASSLTETNTAHADGPGLLGGGDAPGLLGTVGGALDVLASLEPDATPSTDDTPASPTLGSVLDGAVANVGATLATAETALDAPRASKPAPTSPADPPGTVFDTLLEAPALEPVRSLIGVEPLLNSVLESPIVDGVLTTLDPVLQTLPPIVEPVLNPLAPLSDVGGGVLPIDSSLAPVIDLVTPVLDHGEKLAPPVPGATPRAPENPVPAPNSPAVPAKPSANPALPSSSAPADEPERATVAAPAIPQPTPFSVPVLGLRTPGADGVPATSADRATAGSIAGIAFSDNAAVFEPLDVAGTDAISASSRAQSGWPAQLYSGSAFASAAAGLSSFASSASAVAVLAMAIAAGALALSSRRVNLEWPVPPAMAWAPEIPPAR